MNIRFESPVTRTQKRSYQSDEDEDEDEEGVSKKSRKEGTDEESGDADLSNRSRKRGIEEDGRGKRRDKRQKKGTKDEVDEVDDDESSDPESISRTRGKKRGRAEAGSTMGIEDEDTERKASRRKRRTMIKRKSVSSSAASRGLKRDRESESHGSDGEQDDRAERTEEKRKGKKTKPSTSLSSLDERDDPLTDGNLSESGSFRGKRVGEIWKVNGVTYKIGVDGNRLRQALVKRARSKFVMVGREFSHHATHFQCLFRSPKTRSIQIATPIKMCSWNAGSLKENIKKQRSAMSLLGKIPLPILQVHQSSLRRLLTQYVRHSLCISII